MPVVAVTRLRLRSPRFLLPFAWISWRCGRQARRAPGNLGVRVRNAEGRAFWTLTAWRDEAALAAYRGAPPHRQAMPKLLEWCDEAAVAQWQQESPEVPDWDTAARRLSSAGRLSRVLHASSDQQAGRLDFTRRRS